LVNNPTTHLAAYYLYAHISAVGREKLEEEVALMRRIIMLSTLAAALALMLALAGSASTANPRE
jgi:hypothetical protein